MPVTVQSEVAGALSARSVGAEQGLCSLARTCVRDASGDRRGTRPFTEPTPPIGVS